MKWWATVILAGLAGSAQADLISDFTDCKAETDSLRRLTCFDAIVVDGASDKSAVSTPAVSGAPIKLAKAVLRVQLKDFGRSVYNPRIELVPTFKNDTKKTVVAIEHTLVITDAFGDKVIDSVSKLDVKIRPGKTAQSETFYYWEDNQFIANEPFDKLYGPVNTGVAKASLTVTKAVFSDGTSESYR